MENCEVSGNAYTVPIDGISIVEASSTGVWLDNLRTKNNEVLKNGASVKATVYSTMEVLFRRFT